MKKRKMFQYSYAKCADSENQSFHSMLEKFLINHAKGDTEGSTITLSFRESIAIIADINWHLRDRISCFSDLIDEFTGILHTVHRETDIIDHLFSHHTITVMSIGEMNSRYDRSEYPSSHKYHTPEKWDIGVCFFDKSRAVDYIDSFITFEFCYKFPHISHIMLTISIECDDIFEIIETPSYPSKSCLERCSCSAINRVTEIDYTFTKSSTKKFFCSVS